MGGLVRFRIDVVRRAVSAILTYGVGDIAESSVKAAEVRNHFFVECVP